MKTKIAVPVPTEQFLELANFLHSNGDPRDPVEMVSTAIEYWLENASWKPELLSASDAQGYQWKNLFLPDGTQVRMQYKGAFSYAKVEGDELIYNGVSISPASLANAVAGGNRNAWRDLWIKRPKDSQWILADDCRRQEKDSSDSLNKELDEIARGV